MSQVAFELSTPSSCDLAAGVSTTVVHSGVSGALFTTASAQTASASETAFAFDIPRDYVLDASSVLMTFTPRLIVRLEKITAADAAVVPFLTAAGATNPNAWAWASHGLARIANSVSFSAGGSAMITRRLANLISPLSLMVSGDRMTADPGQLATPDLVQDFNHVYAAAGGAGTVPFGAGFGNGYYLPRHLHDEVVVPCDAAGAPINYAAWAAGDAADRYVAIEAPFTMRVPLEFFDQDAVGIANLGQVQISYSWDREWAKVLSVAPASFTNCRIAAVTMPAFTRPPTISYNQVLAKPHIVAATADTVQSYPYYAMEQQENSVVMRANTSETLHLSARAIGTVPSKIVVAIARDVSASGGLTPHQIASTPNIFAEIERCEIRFAGHASATALDKHALFRLAQKNGMNRSSLELRAGSIVIFDLEAGDLPLGDFYVGQSNISSEIQVSLTARTGVAGTYTASVLALIPAAMQTSKASGAEIRRGVSLSEPQAAALFVHDGQQRRLENRRILGGSIFGFIKKWGSRILNAVPAVRAAVPFITSAAPHLLSAFKTVTGSGQGQFAPTISAGGCGNALAMPKKEPKKRGSGIDSGEGYARIK